MWLKSLETDVWEMGIRLSHNNKDALIIYRVN